MAPEEALCWRKLLVSAGMQNASRQGPVRRQVRDAEAARRLLLGEMSWLSADDHTGRVVPRKLATGETTFSVARSHDSAPAKSWCGSITTTRPAAVGGGIDPGASATEDFSPPSGAPGAASLAASPGGSTDTGSTSVLSFHTPAETGAPCPISWYQLRKSGMGSYVLKQSG